MYWNTDTLQHIHAIKLLLQVSTCKQLATGFVCAFPWLLRMSELIQVEVARRGPPSLQNLSADYDSIRAEQHAANWAQIPRYLEQLTEHDLDVHVPFLASHVH